MIPAAEPPQIRFELRIARGFQRNEANRERAVACLSLHWLVGVCLGRERFAQQREEHAESLRIEPAELRKSGLAIRGESRACRFSLGGFVRDTRGQRCAFFGAIQDLGRSAACREHSLLAKLWQHRNSRSGSPRRIRADLFVGDGKRKMPGGRQSEGGAPQPVGMSVCGSFCEPKRQAPEVRRSIAAPRAAFMQERDCLQEAGNGGEGARTEQLGLRAFPAIG